MHGSHATVTLMPDSRLEQHNKEMEQLRGETKTLTIEVPESLLPLDSEDGLKGKLSSLADAQYHIGQGNDGCLEEESERIEAITLSLDYASILFNGIKDATTIEVPIALLEDGRLFKVQLDNLIKAKLYHQDHIGTDDEEFDIYYTANVDSIASAIGLFEEIEKHIETNP